MGLDMYLTADVYVSRPDSAAKWHKHIPDGAFDAVLGAIGALDDVDDDDYSGVTVQVPVGYWRKANAIHGYFVEKHGGGVDECQRIEVTRDDVKALRDLAQTVLDDRGKADELLPPVGGFFFGSTEVDEGYEDDLKRTVEICDRALASKWDTFVYQASW